MAAHSNARRGPNERLNRPLVCCLLIASVVAWTDPAAAATVTEVAQSYTVGPQGATAVNEFTVASTGTAQVSLTDLLWPQALASLSFELTSASGQVIGTFSGSGTAEFDLTTSGSYFALTFGKSNAAGPSSLAYGSYGIAVQFAPTVVPLPPALALLGSALVAMLAWSRPRSWRGAADRVRSRVGTAAAINV